MLQTPDRELNPPDNSETCISCEEDTNIFDRYISGYGYLCDRCNIDMGEVSDDKTADLIEELRDQEKVLTFGSKSVNN